MLLFGSNEFLRGLDVLDVLARLSITARNIQRFNSNS